MRRFKIRPVIFLLILFLTFKLEAQDCFYYHEYFCKYPNSSFFYSGQSRSALFTFGMTSEFKLITFGNEDYHLAICYEKKYKNVRLRIMEDNESRNIIYDNAEFGYKTEMNFSNNVARRLIVEISVPEDPASSGDQELRCVGVLLHFRRTYNEPKNKIGF